MDRHQSNVERADMVEQRSNYSMEEIEEVYDKVEEERRNINHILEIKELLVNNENETEKEITVRLQKLALIVVSLEDLMVTDILTTVSGLLLHRSKEVIREARRVFEKFKRIIEDQVDENADLSSDPIIHNHGGQKFDESQINPTREDNEELASAASITAIKRQKQILINRVVISPKNHTTPHKKNEINEGHGYPSIKETKVELLLKQDLQPPTKKLQNHVRGWKCNKMSYNRPSDTQFSLQRFAKQRQQTECNNDRKIKKDENKFHQRSTVGRPRLHSRGTSNDAAKKEKKHETLKRKVHEGYQAHERGLKLRGTSDDAAKMEEKLETSKRKLHEGYQAHKRGLKLRRTSDDAAKMEEKIETSKRKPYEGNQEHERGLNLRGSSYDASKMEEKLETSKRKLHEGYQAHERERRSTRYFEGYECHLPKGKHSRRSSRPKFSNRRRYN
ncbi:putative mediator of RNA polymerase II transcription subunit 26b [Glycine max]|nr:putative mediator of RNA polymerase II transcription subunit 26b [Glycine max]